MRVCAQVCGFVWYTWARLGLEEAGAGAHTWVSPDSPGAMSTTSAPALVAPVAENTAMLTLARARAEAS